MLYIIVVATLFALSLIKLATTEQYIHPARKYPADVRYYPRKTPFRKADLIDRGCKVFIQDCPRAYKQNMVCARHYDGHYKTFNSYCDMEYENCNSWRQWSMVNHARC